LGRRLQRVRPEWIYLSSDDADLADREQTIDCFRNHMPDAVIHLAGRVGGIQDNVSYPADFFIQNARINMNVVDACVDLGIPRLLASLSTCAFPDQVNKYPFSEENIHDGPPAGSNLSYGYSKRLMYVHINSVREQHGLNYSTFSPSNLYGPEDNFDPKSSHFVAAAVRKIAEAKDGDEVVFWGTGKPLRQQLYVDDLCGAIPSLLEEHNSNVPLIVAPDENLSIDEMVRVILEESQKDLKVVFDGHLDGQYRKDGSNKKFKSLVNNHKFTPFKEGVSNTYKWYEKRIYNWH